MPADVTIDRLRCEYLTDPLGVDELRPRLSWQMRSARRGARQTAYQVRVASSRERLLAGNADLWDSGRVQTDASCHIEYAGAPLTSRQACHWHVRVWDETGAVVDSSPALWTMGLLQPGDWQARWIAVDPEVIRRDPDAQEPTATQPGAVPLFRKAFAVPRAVRRATLYATARGLIDVTLNGRHATADQFVPEWTDYHRRLHYRTFDVTDLLAAGENAMGVQLGDGWHSGFVGWQETRGQYGTLQNSFLLQLEVETDDGATLVVCSDGSWRCDTGPILSSDFMLGEHYDARRERPGWDAAGFDASAWLPAVEVAPPRVHVPHYAFSGNAAVAGDTPQPLPLVAQRSEPVRIVETLRPVAITEPTPGAFVYDFDQNLAGFVRLSVAGPAGARVQLRHGERLNPDGTLYTENLRRADATDLYVLRGSDAAAPETWQPRFTFHGFQYLELTGLDAAPSADAVEACVVMSSTPPAGQFECSEPLVNRLWQNALWGQKGNFLTVPTDCPQRDERLGWMGDAQVFLRSATYNMDVAAFFTKWMQDVCDSQDIDGVFPDVAPRLREGADNFVGLDGLGGAAGWADAGVIVPWTLWRVYGDTRVAQRHFDAMVRWLDWLERENPAGIRLNKLGNNYGDWLCIPSDTTFRTHSPMKTLLATAYWADDAAKLAELARALGRTADAERFTAMFHRVRDAWRAEWHVGDGRLAVETQTAYLLALAFDLLPQEVRARAAEHLVEAIDREGGQLSTGFIGVSHLNPQLTLAGRADVAYRLLLSREYPSWLYPVLHGATTIWERWNGWTAEDGFFNPQMNSFNHYSLGSVSEWLFRHVAGIELDPAAPGFQRFVIRPHVDDRLEYAGASYQTHYGKIESRWRREPDGTLELHATVPANTSAIVCIPAGENATITESEAPADHAAGLESLPREPEYARYRAAAGKFCFRVRP
ncbi:MAG: family 78 glycoside hydrolase catalytic domain [Planctomycetales bacterium]|nr:family 78 glycoside hydrolase catalytic domain [Planctomycetales bacterium]